MRLKQARSLLRVVIDKAKEDPDYREQLRCHPVTLLVKEGLPYDVIEDFLREATFEAEVSGYIQTKCSNTCAYTQTPFE